jgi:hypothetical protein
MRPRSATDGQPQHGARAGRRAALLLGLALLAGCASAPADRPEAEDDAPRPETFRATIASLEDPLPCLERQLELEGFTVSTSETGARVLLATREEDGRTNRVVIHYVRNVETGEIEGEITDATSHGRLDLRKALGFCAAF